MYTATDGSQVRGSDNDAALLNTLSNGLRAVEVLADGRRTLRELASELDLPRQTAYRIVRTLTVMGWAERREVDDTYGLTTRLWSVGARSHSSADLRETWAEAVRKLGLATGETVHLAVYDDGWSVYIAKHDGTQPISSYTRLGGRSPAYCVATGKVLLASQPRDEIDRILGGELTAFAQHTITDPAKLRFELEQVRDQGFAVNNGEYRDEVGGIAVPIWSPMGEIIASIGFSGPIGRITSNIESLREALEASVRMQ